MLPLDRIFEKLDYYYEANDNASALNLLNYWENDAMINGDERGLVSLFNEKMGIYRKAGDGEKALFYAESAEALAEKLKLLETPSGSTILVNVATVYSAFDKSEKAEALFSKIQPVLEGSMENNDSRLGSFYNNYGTALKNLGKFDEALCVYEKALEIMKNVEYGEGEMAITYLNMANVIEDKLGLIDGCELIDKYLETAEKLLLTEGLPDDGRMRFIKEKCRPVFEYYGYLSTP